MTARNEFSVRITCDVVESDSRFLTLWGRLGGIEAALVCRETGGVTEKDHCHAYIRTNGALHDASVRHHVAKVFGVSGANLSVKDPNKGQGSTDKCLQYICKGGGQGSQPCLVVRHGFSPEQTVEYHAKYWAVNEAVVSSRSAAAVKRPSMYDELLAFTQARECASSEDVIAASLLWAKNVRKGVHFVSFANAVALLCHQIDEKGEFAFETRLRNYVFSSSEGGGFRVV